LINVGGARACVGARAGARIVSDGARTTGVAHGGRGGGCGTSEAEGYGRVVVGLGIAEAATAVSLCGTLDSMYWDRVGAGVP
jgi:hypothetical protein